MERILITSALPYANGHIHLGHCAGAYLPADICARYLRLKGVETLYICGSDEHGVAITIAAEKEKVKPEKIIDKYHYANLQAFEKFGMTFDNYSRTSLPIHHKTAKEFFKIFLDKDLLFEKEEKQFYDGKAKMFLPDRYVEGECPNCGYDKARGDQCDSCGAYYDQLELKNPVSLVTGDKPTVKDTIHWYMKFDEFQEFLEDYIDSHKDDWKHNVLQQTKNWLKQGLTDRAITRDLKWGVKIDDIDGVPEEKARGKALYVWFEAVLGYISSTKEFFEKQNKSADEWEKWWKDQETRYIAFIGKDNIVFHTLIFPALLKARGEGFILPDNVPANEFLNLEGKKFSKSRNWSIDLKEFVEEFEEPHYIDALRYSLTMNLPETRDSDFAWKDYQSRNNNELAAIYGNFVNRTLHFIGKKFDGSVPKLPDKYKQLPDDWKAIYDELKPTADLDDLAEKYEIFSENDLLMLSALKEGVEKVSSNYEKFRFRDAATATMNIARAANKYFNDEEPWKTAKSNSDLCAKTLYVCAQLVRSLSILFAPLVPFSTRKIADMFGLEPYAGEPAGGEKTEDLWSRAFFPSVEQGTRMKKTDVLFEKVENKFVKRQVAKLGAKEEEAASENLITIDDFFKTKLKAAKIVKAEKVKKSDKLLRLEVDLGDEKKQIIAGLAKQYSPEDLLGKTVVVVANLKPAKLMGLESQGMLLAAKDGGKFAVLSPDKDVKPGAEIG